MSRSACPPLLLVSRSRILMQSPQPLKNCLTTAAHLRLLSSRHRDPSTRAFAPTRNARWPWTRLAQLSPPWLNHLLSTKILNEGRKPSGSVYVSAPSDPRPVFSATVQSSPRPAVLLLAHITYSVSFPESVMFSKSEWELTSKTWMRTSVMVKEIKPHV